MQVTKVRQIFGFKNGVSGYTRVHCTRVYMVVESLFKNTKLFSTDDEFVAGGQYLHRGGQAPSPRWRWRFPQVWTP